MRDEVVKPSRRTTHGLSLDPAFR